MSATGLVERLRGGRAGEARFDLFKRGLHATDTSIYQVMPAGVVIPATVEHVVVALDFARARKAP